MASKSVNNNDIKPVVAWKKWLGVFLKYILPTALSVGLCYVLFRDINFGEMYDFIVAECDFTLILISIIVGVSGFWLRGLRWRIQLRAIGINPPRRVMFWSIAGTYAVNLVVPRMGEFWRCEYLARRQDESFATVLGSMVSERLADTFTVLLLILVTLLIATTQIEQFVDAYPAMFDFVGALLSNPLTYIVGIGALVAIWLIFKLSSRRSWAQKIIAQFRKLLGGFSSIFHMQRGWLWLLLTLLLWGSYFFQMWLCFQAFAPTRAYMAEHGILVLLVCFTLGSLSMAVPSNGGIGPYQIAVGFGLQCFLVGTLSDAQGYSFATLILGAQMLSTIVCGLYSFISIAIDNRRLSRLSAEVGEKG